MTEAIVSGPVLQMLPKLFCALFLFIVLFLNRKRQTRSEAVFLYAVAGLSIMRDVVVAVVPGLAPQAGADALILAVYGLWYGRSTRNTAKMIAFAALNVAFAALLVVHDAAGVLPGLTDSVTSWLVVADAAAVAVAFQTVSESAPSAGAAVIRSVRPAFAILAAVSFIGSAAVGHASPLSQYLFIELGYFFPLLVSFALRAHEEGREREELAFAADSIDPLYEFLRQTSSSFGRDGKPDELLADMNEAAIAGTNADGGMVLLVDDFEDVLAVKSFLGKFPPVFKIPDDCPRKATRVEAYCRHARFRLGETIYGEAATGGKPVFIPDVTADERVVINGTEDFFSLNSLIIVPLMAGERVYGVLALVKKALGERFTERDFEKALLLVRFGSLILNAHIAVQEASERTEIERSATIAADIQQTILPRRLPELEHASFGAFSIPTRGVCGDYYDIIPVRRTKICLVIGDVAGKGIPSSIVMVMIRSILHLVTSSQKDIATIMGWVNRGITGRIDMDHFATLALLNFDMETGAIEYANAGHQPAMIYRAGSGSVETVNLKDVPIGVERTTEYGGKSLTVADGDIVILYTDGIVEATDQAGAQYGRERLAGIIAANHSLTSKEIANKVKLDVQDFRGKARQHDDQTLLVMKVKM